MTENIEIRLAKERDIDGLVQFNLDLARETERRDLPRHRVAFGVRDLLKHPEFGFYLVAERNGSSVGCMMVTYEWSDWRNGIIWWLQSVYVQPTHRGQGIFKGLYDHVKAMASQDDRVCGFRLYVEGQNDHAQQIYQRLGLSETPYKVYEVWTRP